MRIIADLHVHSRYARATSKDLGLESLEKWGRIKGLDLIGTGDFQHPEHWKAIEKLREDKGILWSESGFPFVIQSEISLMFSDVKRRAVHMVVFAPSKLVAGKIIDYLKSKGRIDYDGRPIFGITARDFVHDLKEIDDMIELIPAHVMTPWFGLFGSKSGFDNLEEAFKDVRDKIYAVESGMSADPEMLWSLGQRFNIVSFSDAHSAWPFRIGREATIFDIVEISYGEIIKAIRTGEGLVGTIETPPEYGKYHWDGHRNCVFSCSPEESKKLGGKCKICGKGLTIGVEYRIKELAKIEMGIRPENGKDFFKVLPLQEIISLVYGFRLESKKSWDKYNDIIGKFKNENEILLEIGKEEMLKKGIDEKIAELILLGREGKLKVKPGYDGEYGVLEFDSIGDSGKEVKISGEKQMRLF